jgi:hypothetical protein
LKAGGKGGKKKKTVVKDTWIKYEDRRFDTSLREEP